MNITKQLQVALDPVIFVHEWLRVKLDDWQIEFLRANEKLIIVNASRQIGKSTAAAFRCIHRALFFPGSTILIVSPYMKQSKELLRKIKEYIKLLPIRIDLIEDTKESIEFGNSSRIICLSGEDANIRSYSAHLIVVDEAARIKKAVYLALIPMTLETNGTMIMLSTPFGPQGPFYEIWMDGGEECKRIKVIASELKRIDKKTLEGHKGRMSDFWYRQEYCGEFLQSSDQLFNYDSIIQAVTDLVTPLFDEKGNPNTRIHPEGSELVFGIGLDPGVSINHTGIVVIEFSYDLKEQNVIYIERLPLKITYSTIIEKVANLHGLLESIGRTVLLIDDTGAGHPLFERLKERGLQPIGICFTSGNDERKINLYRFNVPKRNLVESLNMILQDNKLRIAAGIDQSELLIEELLNYQYSITPTGTDVYGSEGSHDDLVTALMLLVWHFSRDPWAKIKFLRV